MSLNIHTERTSHKDVFMQALNLRQRRLKRQVERAEMAAVFAKSAVAMALSKVWQSRLRQRYCTGENKLNFNMNAIL